MPLASGKRRPPHFDNLHDLDRYGDTLNPKPGHEQIADERATHVRLGYISDHDKKHRNGELAQAAICYVFAADPLLDPEGDYALAAWPFDCPFIVPTDPVDALRIGGAFVAAEIDRLQALAL